ncbi:hypothetical protein MJH12_11275 [bacterium]|nr:hypothetical protein [bacterium]
MNSKLREPRIGLHLCYAYSSFFLGAVGAFHFSLLSMTWYYLLFLSFANIFSVLFSLFLLVLHLNLFFSVRNLFCKIYFFKEGLLIKYFDGRHKLYHFEEIEKFEFKWRYFGGFYSFQKKSGESGFLFLGFLLCSDEISAFIEEKVEQFHHKS